MKERERILELVKNGVISTEEALILLENIATEKDEQRIDREATQVHKQSHQQTTHDDETMDNLKENEAETEVDTEYLEEKLAEIAEKANIESVKLDELNEKMLDLKQDIRSKEDDVTVLNTMEELDSLTEDKQAEREQLEQDIVYLKETLVELTEKKKVIEDTLKSLKEEQKKLTREDWKAQFDIPENWKEQANDTISQVSEKVGEAGSQFGTFIKKAIDTISTSVNDNVDWKDINIKVPGVASQSFSHEFFYPNSQATLIDVKVANGSVSLQSWDKPDIKVEADIKFYGKLTDATLFEAFLERSDIDVDDERVSFQIPNKRIKSDLVFYLPAHLYDHVSVKMLNGDIDVTSLEVGDMFVKTTNGDMTLKQLQASMLEVEGVNGDIDVLDSDILDFSGETVNGDIVTRSKIQTIQISLINGDIKSTISENSLKRVKINAVNGNIKVAIPETVNVEGNCQTNFGSIKNRLSDIDIIREQKDRMNQKVLFRRVVGEEVATIDLTTTTGSIYLKDTE